PTFLPIMPLTIFFSSCKGYWLAAHVTANVTPRETRASCKLLQLDLDVHASGELEAHQGLHRLSGRLQNVDQALVGAALELLAAVLVLVGRTQDGDHLTVGGQGDGAGHAGAGALCGLDDLLCRSIDQLDVVALKTDSDFLFDCHVAVPPQNVVYGQLDQSLHTVPGVSRLRIRKAGKPPRSFPGKKSSKDKWTLVLFAHGAGTYPFTVSNSFARFVDRTYSAEITRIGWA